MCERVTALYRRIAIAVLAATIAGPSFAAETRITAVVDQARLVRIPAGTQTLVIGNPTVADVTLLKRNNMMILTPKAFGQTNFIALDAAGNPVAESMIEVVAGTDALVMQLGTERQSYSCAPRCQPVERVGDSDRYLAAVSTAAQAHTARLAGSQAPVSPGSVQVK